LVIDDLWHNEQFNHLPFATSHPSLRFYAAMPISTKSGFSIGTISVMDERPRQGLSEVEVNFLGDMAVTVMDHLEIAGSNEARRRSEKMIKGLGVFMEGRTDLNDWWVELGNDESRSRRHTPKGAGAGAIHESHEGRAQGRDRTSASRKPTAPGKSGEGDASEPASSPGDDSKPLRPPMTRPKANSTLHGAAAVLMENEKDDSVSAPSTSTAGTPDKPRTPRRGYISRTFTPGSQESHISARLKEMFRRAGHIIQESLEVDGALFLDAHTSTLSQRTGKQPMPFSYY
jgi:hypothetical protein